MYTTLKSSLSFLDFLYLSKATGKKQLPSSQIVVQPAASADIYGVVLCISYSKCDWSNAYSLNLQNNGYWQKLTKVVYTSKNANGINKSLFKIKMIIVYNKNKC